MSELPPTPGAGGVEIAPGLLVPPHELELRFLRSPGPGGQNVNKVATAVHLIHEPTGIEVRMQETRSQLQNRDKAWRLLRARVREARVQAAEAARSAERRGMIDRKSVV